MATTFSFDFLRALSAATLGLFAGGMLTEACVLVPYWRSLKASEFLAWYGAQGHRLQGFFGPLTYAAGLVSLAAALISLWEQHPGRWYALVAACVVLAAVATFFVYFGKANASFAAAGLQIDAVTPELARWSRWHWGRTGLSFVAAAAALMAL